MPLDIIDIFFIATVAAALVAVTIERQAEKTRQRLLNEAKRRAAVAEEIQRKMREKRINENLARHYARMAQAETFMASQIRASRQSPQWWQSALSLPARPTEQEISKAYRAAARKNHPDMGGNSELMAKINRARDEAMKHMGYAK